MRVCPDCKRGNWEAARRCAHCGYDFQHHDQIVHQAVARVVGPKNPGVAAVLSFLIVGLGQVYNGQLVKGLVLVVLFIVSLAAIGLTIGLITTPVLWLYNVFDAYRTAEAHNRLLQG